MNFDRIIAVRNDKTVYRDSERCLKVFNSGYTKADVLNEALNQARLECSELNVPKVLEVTEIDGKWTIISEFVRGKTLEQLMKDSPEKKKELLRRFVFLQIQTQGVVCEGLISLKEKMILNISRSDLVATTRYDLLMKVEAMHKDNKVCHCEFEPSNIIVTDAGEAYIVDWAHAAQGDPLADAARTYLYCYLQGDMDGARQYLDLYCEMSASDAQVVKKWLPLVAAARSTGCNSAERDILINLVNSQIF